jgi:hypothetical protein
MTYIFLFFQPGSAGNFVSRCLNLLDGANCWAYKDRLPTGIKDKLNLLNYIPVMNSTHNDRNWVEDWESEVVPYQNFNQLSEDAKYGIWVPHPDYNILNKDIAGPDDQKIVFYVDPSENFEWCILNALYKNSYLDVKWLKEGERMRLDPNIHKISLKLIVNSQDEFLEEFKKICAIIGHKLTAVEIISVLMLYDQWRTTILDYDKFDEFKQAIGFCM